MCKRLLGVMILVGGLLAVGSGWAEDVVVSAEQAVPAVVQESIPLEWVWGEIIAIDAAAQTVAVRYLDYETDTEKEINLQADEKTKFSGINGFGDLKVQDTISVDYTVSPDGKNKALVITYEKIEDIEEDDAAAAAAPEQPGLKE